jgi:hypothetical protein
LLTGLSGNKQFAQGLEKYFGPQPYNTYSGLQVGPVQEGQTQPYSWS